MSHHLSPFESLPNEVLMEYFQYFNAQDLFHAFYNLNSRLNGLIQSFQNLKLVFYLNKSNIKQITNDDVFPFYVYTLSIDSAIDINLGGFPNVRRLKFEWFSTKQLLKLNMNVLHYLEELNLEYIETLSTNNTSLCLPSLRILKVRFINLLAYQTILSGCPSLYYFQLSFFTSECCLNNAHTHTNLKRLQLTVSDVVWPWTDDVLNCYLSCVPNLEHFTVYRMLYIARINDFFIYYDWLSSKILHHLPMLRRFYFRLRMSHSRNINQQYKNKIVTELKENFLNMHCGQYQSRLMVESV